MVTTTKSSWEERVGRRGRGKDDSGNEEGENGEGMETTMAAEMQSDSTSKTH